MKTFKAKRKPPRQSIGVIEALPAADLLPSGFQIEKGLHNKYAYDLQHKMKQRGKEEKKETLSFKTFRCLPLQRLKKLGESTFSEIFLDAEQEQVYKIMPLTEKKEYKRVQHTKVQLFIKECLVMQKMNASKYSARMYNWFLVRDRYPDSLMDICDDWAEENKAENLRPRKNNSSGMFGVILMEYAGAELANMDFSKLTQDDVSKITQQLKEFMHDMDVLNVEHRDMHESNILIARNPDGYKIRVIDYSLAQMGWPRGTEESVAVLCRTKKGLKYTVGETLYTDLDTETPWLFSNTAPRTHTEIYSRMNMAYWGNDRWRKKGISNLLWVDYLIQWMHRKKSEIIARGAKSVVKNITETVPDTLQAQKEPEVV